MWKSLSRPALALVLAVAARVAPVDMPAPALAAPDATFTVTSLANSGPGTLRDAIIQANASPFSTIRFSVTGTISPTTALPMITQTTYISGSSGVVLNGALCAGLCHGLHISGTYGTAIWGMTIVRFPNAGIRVELSGATAVTNSHIGTNAAGAAGLGNTTGIILFDANTSAIGGPQPADRNVISGNNQDGIWITSNSGSNVVAGNYIGLHPNGLADLGNGFNGVALTNGALNNVIGGVNSPAAKPRNFIAGNGQYGVGMNGTAANVWFNEVKGNYIGTTVTGTAAVPNSLSGVLILNATNNTIGAPGQGFNLISGNTQHGVLITGTSNNNALTWNAIGVDVAGTAALGNGMDGVRIEHAGNNTVGGDFWTQGNVIGGNAGAGVAIVGAGAQFNLVKGNRIGVDLTGTSAVPNAIGVKIEHAHNGTIGGSVGLSGTVPCAQECNLISGNTTYGVLIAGNNPGYNTVRRNIIGANISGTAGLGNGADGVAIHGGQFTTVGGSWGNGGNLISGHNTGAQVSIRGVTSTQNVVKGNRIGSDITGGVIFAVDDGVRIENAPTNTIGGASGLMAGNACTGDCNFITSHDRFSIMISGTQATSNAVLGNFVGGNVSSTHVSSIGTTAIWLGNGAYSNTVGAPGAGNVVSGNGGDGIGLFGATTRYNTVQANTIGLKPTGASELRNRGVGVWVLAGMTNTIGGNSAAGEGNLISGNWGGGVLLLGGASGNRVLGSIIGLNKTGSYTIGNGYDGVSLQSPASYNTIGGDRALGHGNVIAGNLDNGVLMSGTNVFSNTVYGNYIGTDLTGTAPLHNGAFGAIAYLGAHHNRIGGPGKGNVIVSALNPVTVQSNSDDNVIQSNIIGLNRSATAKLTALSYTCVYLVTADRTRIGGNMNAGEGNTISGCYDGIRLSSSGYNLVQGNHIGANVTGTVGVTNTRHGINLTSSDQNTIGGAAGSGLGNVISSNGSDGIFVASGAWDNKIYGNFIGVDRTGQIGRGNGRHGVYLESPSAPYWDGALRTRIGDPGNGNVISGNSRDGVLIEGRHDYSSVRGNMVGTNVSGTVAIPNGAGGVALVETQYVVVGGSRPSGEGNLLSGNVLRGLYVGGMYTAVVQGNYIGVNVSGTAALPNGQEGVLINTDSLPGSYAPSVVLGGSASAGLGNLISGNKNAGVRVSGRITATLIGNVIGLNAAGTAPISNTGAGVLINSSGVRFTIGGATADERNVISGNGGHGIHADFVTLTSRIAGNYIGLSASGLISIGNRMDGIAIQRSHNVLVGGNGAAGEGNFVSGNAGNGISLRSGPDSGFLFPHDQSRAAVRGNVIGLAANGALIGNVGHGVAVLDADGFAAANNTIGGEASSDWNVIAGNLGAGIAISNHALNAGNAISGNVIYSNTLLGIDLGLNGVTPNDAGDADAGPNGLQNFPTLLAALSDAAGTEVRGRLSSAPSTTYTVRFFSNDACDPSGFGEGRAPVARLSVTTNGSGDATFTATLSPSIVAGKLLTALATDPAGNTSEFSACALVKPVRRVYVPATVRNASTGW